MYVLKEGATIAFWSKASRSGTVVGDLHRYWQFGSGFQNALISGKHFNVVALACVVATISQINSPLLQRASKAVERDVIPDSQIRIQLAQELPEGFTGYVSGRNYEPSLFTPTFGKVGSIVQQ